MEANEEGSIMFKKNVEEEEKCKLKTSNLEISLKNLLKIKNLKEILESKPSKNLLIRARKSLIRRQLIEKQLGLFSERKPKQRNKKYNLDFQSLKYNKSNDVKFKTLISLNNDEKKYNKFVDYSIKKMEKENQFNIEENKKIYNEINKEKIENNTKFLFHKILKNNSNKKVLNNIFKDLKKINTSFSRNNSHYKNNILLPQIKNNSKINIYNNTYNNLITNNNIYSKKTRNLNNFHNNSKSTYFHRKNVLSENIKISKNLQKIYINNVIYN